MAKVKLTRAHNGSSKGETVTIPDEQVKYFENVGLSEKEQKEDITTKELKTKVKTK